LKAEFFKTLGHPMRIRVLELLSIREHAVSELLAEIPIEPASLSQQLAVLRRAGLVTPRREGSAMHYSVTTPWQQDMSVRMPAGDHRDSGIVIGTQAWLEWDARDVRLFAQA